MSSADKGNKSARLLASTAISLVMSVLMATMPFSAPSQRADAATLNPASSYTATLSSATIRATNTTPNASVSQQEVASASQIRFGLNGTANVDFDSPNTKLDAKALRHATGGIAYDALVGATSNQVLGVYSIELKVGDAVQHDNFGNLEIFFPIAQSYTGQHVKVHHLHWNGSADANASEDVPPANQVIYKYAAETSFGSQYRVVETVTYGDDGYCQTSKLVMTFITAEVAKVFVDSLVGTYGNLATVNSMDGNIATVTLDIRSLKVDRETYRRALSESVTDLVVINGSSASAAEGEITSEVVPVENNEAKVTVTDLSTFAIEADDGEADPADVEAPANGTGDDATRDPTPDSTTVDDPTPTDTSTGGDPTPSDTSLKGDSGKGLAISGDQRIMLLALAAACAVYSIVSGILAIATRERKSALGFDGARRPAGRSRLDYLRRKYR